MNAIMSFPYETLAPVLKEYSHKVEQPLRALHPFYQERLANLAYKTVLEAGVEAPEKLDVCKEILKIFAGFDRETERLLYMSSYLGLEPWQFSDPSLKESRKLWSRKSKKVRRNIRRYLNIPVPEDTVEQEFNSRKVARAESYIVKKTESGKKISAYENAQYRKTIRRAKFNLIAKLIKHSSIDILLYKGFFLTLTMPSEFRKTSYEVAMAEIRDRWKKIMEILQAEGIIVLGVKKIHLHKDETPHIHLSLYCNPIHEGFIRETVWKFFINDEKHGDEAFQEIYDHDGALAYLLRDFCLEDDETFCDIKFIGLKAGFLTFWDHFYKRDYGNSKLSHLSNNRLFKARRFLKDPEDLKNPASILFLLRAFAEPSLNEISKWHINLKHLTLTDEWKTLRIADLQFCIHGRQNIIPKRRRTSFVNPEKRQLSNVFSILIRENQEGAITAIHPLRECVDRRFLRTRAELALCRARPPPKPSDTNDRFRIISGEREVLRRPV
ncbi:replication endonuclease [Gluconobacter thailandicus]|uniref:Replication endonuclease n=2 Tax=Gluconobacter thailandicus TaxID=257438 RepID=A0AAP9ER87_GLUTH|nr:replication endonuclease [Gluconobacter thailandicus]